MAENQFLAFNDSTESIHQIDHPLNFKQRVYQSLYIITITIKIYFVRNLFEIARVKRIKHPS